MQRSRRILVIEALLFALLGFGIYRASERGAFPLPIENHTKGTSSTAVFIRSTEDHITHINKVAVHTAAEVEFYVNNFKIGEYVSVTFADGRSQQVKVIPYYDSVYTVIQSIAVFVFASLGLFIFLRKRGSKLALQFHFLTLFLAGLIAHTTGSFSIPTPTLSFVLESLFHLFYAMSGVIFLQFILTFGDYKQPFWKYVIGAFYSLAAALAVGTSFYFIQTNNISRPLHSFEMYDMWLDTSRLYFAFLFLSGLGVLIHAIRTRTDPVLNKQLSWVLYGCTISILTYILLWQVPLILESKDIISEEVMLLTSLIAPISIAIGIVRHKLFDIELIIRKTISYAVLAAGIVTVYGISILALTWVAQQFNTKNSIMPTAAAAILSALVFEPMRRKTISIVDRRFFRTSYNFREAQRQFVDDITNALDLRSLAEFVISRIQQLIPVERIGFFIMNDEVKRMRLLAHEGFALLERHGVTFTPEDLKTGLEHPVALPEFVEEAVIEIADRPTFERWKIVLVIPMLKERRHPVGFIVLGRRRSETKFTGDDVEMLTQMAAQSVIALERLLLQQELLIEQAESQRLDELNRLKSYFVSSVTHDLKTPLTSIKLYAELLRSDLSDAKKQAYLSTIEGETDRLARLITNVLDFARIEQGTKHYDLRPVDLTEVARVAIEVLQYQLETEGFSLDTILPQEPVSICADRDAILRVVINLISNALKYSDTIKSIRLQVISDKNAARLIISDRGIGMTTDQLAHIFEPFYRVSQRDGSGAGLGLAIVKHTMDAHHATIQVESTPGQGTVFTLTFPTI